MTEIVVAERKSNVLHHPMLPCLSRYHTINLAAGCPHNCRYCYAQSFRNYPGKGTVLFYANALEQLRRELAGKRDRVEMVYFSTGCEPFMPFPEILETLYGCMELLLRHGSFLLISTKAAIPEDFLRLFGRFPSQVHVHIGLTTADDDVRNVLEPQAACVQQRLTSLRRVLEAGAKGEVRMDPLIPELTDTDDSFRSLCHSVAGTGCRSAVASFLFASSKEFVGEFGLG